LVASSLS